MKILVIGATGTIGAAVANVLEARHEVIGASRTHSATAVDVSNPDSIRRLYAKVGRVDAVISAAGDGVFRALAALSDEDFALGLTSKLMGQVNVVRFGLDAVTDGGSFTVTTGILSRHPTPGSVAISIANAGLEAFVRAAALELPRGIRINAVAPGWVRETLLALKMDPSLGIPASTVAHKYAEAVEGSMTGEILDAVASAE